MISKSASTAISAVLITVGFLLAIFLTRFVEEQYPPLPEGYADEDIALNGSNLKGFAFGAEGLIADWYWMNSLQYMGKKISAVGLENLNLDDMRPLNPRLLYPYLNNAADLDPKFLAPYSYGATILPAIDPQQAVALTEKGIANNPDAWRLHQYLGYIHWTQGDYQKASEVYQKGSLIPGAPVFMRMMAARMKTEGGSRDLAREIYGQLLAEAQDDVSRQNAELRLMQIDSLDELDVLNPVLQTFRSQTGRCATRWQEVLPLLSKTRLPGDRALRVDVSNNVVDPSGVPYSLNREACVAELGANTKIPRR